MDLQKTIADLDAQAAQFTEAANALRALVGQSNSQPAAKAKPGRKAGTSQSAGKAAKKGRRGKRGPVSAETRAKIAEAIRARHAARKAQTQGQGQSQEQA